LWPEADVPSSATSVRFAEHNGHLLKGGPGARDKRAEAFALLMMGRTGTQRRAWPRSFDNGIYSPTIATRMRRMSQRRGKAMSHARSASGQEQRWCANLRNKRFPRLNKNYDCVQFPSLRP